MKEFVYGQHRFKYEFIRQERKTLSLTVRPDMGIVLKCPLHADENRINLFLKQKWKWLNKQLEFFRKFQKNIYKKEYISGESFMYLGRQYQLIVKSDKKNKVLLTKGKLLLYTRKRDNAKHNKELLYDWYREKSKDRFQRMLETSYQRLKKYEFNEPKLKVKTMKSRWGSCSARKETVTLNTELVKAPSHCIEYVIMHELCHMKHPNHTKSFYDFLALVMPDWIERKKRLEKAVL